MQPPCSWHLQLPCQPGKWEASGECLGEDWSHYQSNMFTYAFLKIKSICAKTKEYKIWVQDQCFLSGFITYN